MTHYLPSDSIYTGYVSIGTTASLLIPDPDVIALEVKHGIFIRVPSVNSNTIFISDNPGVTNTNSSTGGFPFDPGSELFLPFSKPWKLYGVSGGTGQHLKFMVF